MSGRKPEMARTTERGNRSIAASSAGGSSPASTPLSPAASASRRNPRASYPPQAPAMLTFDMVRFYFVPISDRQLEEWIVTEKFPRHDVKDGKLRFWFRTTVEQWLEAKGKVA